MSPSNVSTESDYASNLAWVTKLKIDPLGLVVTRSTRWFIVEPLERQHTLSGNERGEIRKLTREPVRNEQ